MNKSLLSYSQKDSFIHKLTGATKMICFLVWSLIGMLSFDTRVLLFMFLANIAMLIISKIKFSEISFIVYFMLFFLVMNNITIFVFAPYHGVELYNSRHDLLRITSGISVTSEQLFYQFNVTLKYFILVPMAILFITTTDPSEFAASLNRIGVSYRIGYAVSITLRYIPDIQRDYFNISVAQQARGIDLSKNERFIRRIKNTAAILVPLVFSSFDRIQTIANTMELRRFGKHRKRTFYRYRPFSKMDIAVIGMFVMIFVVSMIVTYYDGSRFYNPFL